MQKDVEALVRDAMPLAESLARRMEQRLGGVIAGDELVALAQPVLFEAARTWDPEKSPFPAYLTMKLKWAMLDEVRKLRGRNKVVRRATALSALERIAEDEAEAPQAPPAELKSEEEYQEDLRSFLAKRAAALAVGLCAAMPAQAAHESPEEGLARAQLRHELMSAVGQLPDRQRALVERHYFGEEKFEEIATDLGISKSWASRVHAQAMESLASALRKKV